MACLVVEGGDGRGIDEGFQTCFGDPSLHVLSTVLVCNKELDDDATSETATVGSGSGGNEGEGPQVATLNADNGASPEAVLSAVALETDMVCFLISLAV